MEKADRMEEPGKGEMCKCEDDDDAAPAVQIK